MKRELHLTWEMTQFWEIGFELIDAGIEVRRVRGISAFTNRLLKDFPKNIELRLKIEALERDYDQRFSAVFDAIKRLLAEPETPSAPIGFDTER